MTPRKKRKIYSSVPQSCGIWTMLDKFVDFCAKYWKKRDRMIVSLEISSIFLINRNYMCMFPCFGKYTFSQAVYDYRLQLYNQGCITQFYHTYKNLIQAMCFVRIEQKSFSRVAVTGPSCGISLPVSIFVHWSQK